MRKAYSYHRFSTPAQVSGDKLMHQLKAAREYADLNNLELDEGLSFQDLGVSAFHGHNRESGRLGDFLTAVRQGFVSKGSYLLVESLDRLSRDTARRALRTLEDICDEGITVVTLIDNQVYSADRLDQDPTSLLISLVIFLRANEESRTKSIRVKAAWERKLERARKGENVLLSKMFPSWIRRKRGKFVVDHEKAKPVKLAFYLAELGIGSSIIAKALNRNGYPTLRGGKFWHKDTVQILLRNPAPRGAHLPHFYKYIRNRRTKTPGEPIERYYPKIISKKRWLNVQKILNERSAEYLRKYGSVRKDARANLLSWLSKCPKCGHSMGLRRIKPDEEAKGVAHRHVYVCTFALNSGDCDYVTVPYDPIEKTLLDGCVPMMERHIEEYTSINPFLGEGQDKQEFNLLQTRAAAIKQTVETEPLDRHQLNRRLRVLLKTVVIDYESSELMFNWGYGGQSRMPYQKNCSKQPEFANG